MAVRDRPAFRPEPAQEGATELASGVARYRRLFEIGKGGMGSVEVALERGEGGFERIVAVKRMLPDASREARHTEMFLREARLAALLAHPNVVHAFAFGESNGELYLAMEYVEGEPLSHVLRIAGERGEALPPVLVAHILAELCDGLHAAHELRDVNGNALNVVHRDVSPHNVMVSYEGHVKLLDFGVAKVEAQSGVTRTGEVKGKTAYMSPEQAMGEPLDRRSDLFSVGAVLFECLTGRRMWGTGTDLETLRKLALEAPPRLDAERPSPPRALCDLHLRLVARAAADRPKDARAVAAELRAFIAQAGAYPDAGVVAATMSRLFAAEAAERRRALNEALSEAAPTRVEALRESLSVPPPAPFAPGARAPEVPSGALTARAWPAAEAALEPERASEVTSRSARPSPRSPPIASRAGVVVAALAGLAAAGAIVALMGDRAPHDATGARPASSSTPVSSSVVASVSTSPSAPLPPAAASMTSPEARTVPPVREASAPTATASRRVPPSHVTKPAGKPAPKSTGHVDVDPEPF